MSKCIKYCTDENKQNVRVKISPLSARCFISSNWNASECSSRLVLLFCSCLLSWLDGARLLEMDALLCFTGTDVSLFFLKGTMFAWKQETDLRGCIRAWCCGGTKQHANHWASVERRSIQSIPIRATPFTAPSLFIDGLHVMFRRFCRKIGVGMHANGYHFIIMYVVIIRWSALLSFFLRVVNPRHGARRPKL